MKNKPVVVIDSCSYTYLNLPLSLTEKVNLWALLKRNAKLTCSPEVVAESNRNPQTLVKQALELDGMRHKFSKTSIEDYEQHLFGKVLNPKDGDKGERDNFAVSLDLFWSGSFGTVYLTDDENHDILNKFLPAFPICQRWTSFDVILFLYLREHKQVFSKEFAEGAVRDLIAHFRENARSSLQNQKEKEGRDNFWFSETFKKAHDRFVNLQTQYLSRIEIIFNYLQN